MKNSLLYLVPLIGLLVMLSGCETTTSQSQPGDSIAVRLDGNKFDHGKRVRRLISFEGKGGALQSEDNPNLKGMPFSFTRNQVFDETEPEFESNRKIRTTYYIADDFSWARGGERDEYFEQYNTMPLRGYAIEGEHDGKHWNYSLKNRRPDSAQKDALKEIIYHNRAEYPKSALRIGSTWSHSPLFVNAYLRRDIRNVVGNVTFTLLRVEDVEGERSAIIGLDLDSAGDEVREDGSVAAATIALKGEIVLSLKTYLETSIRLKGELSGSVVGNDGKVLLYTSPVQLIASESFVNNDDLGF